jgi:hypothetical protein
MKNYISFSPFCQNKLQMDPQKTNSLKIKENNLVGKQISDIDPFRTFID